MQSWGFSWLFSLTTASDSQYKQKIDDFDLRVFSMKIEKAYLWALLGVGHGVLWPVIVIVIVIVIVEKIASLHQVDQLVGIDAPVVNA